MLVPKYIVILATLCLTILKYNHATSYPPSIMITGTVRDMPYSHRDFESNTASSYAQTGLLWPNLDVSTNWPVFVAYSQRNASAGTLLGDKNQPEATQPRNKVYALNNEGRFHFDEYYMNVPGLNIPYTVPLNLSLQNATSGTYSIDLTGVFFPLGTTKGYSTETTLYSNKNFAFTTEYRLQFYYRGGETFSFSGDDDLWVFINNTLTPCDLGGIHSPRTCSVQLDSLGLVVNTTYSMLVLHAERHTDGSNFALTTSILPEDHPPHTYNLALTINEGGSIGFTLATQFSDEDAGDSVFYGMLLNNASMGLLGVPTNLLGSEQNTLTPADLTTIPANLTGVNATLATLGRWYPSGARFNFTSGADWNGTVNLPFVMNDTQLVSNVANVTITVLPVNDPPVAYNGNENITQDDTIIIQLNYTNIDPVPSDIICFRLVSPQPSLGNVKWIDQFKGLLQFSGVFSGTDYINYVVNDRGLGCNCSNITIVAPPADLVQLGSGDSNVGTITVEITAVPTTAVSVVVATNLPAIPTEYTNPSTEKSTSNTNSLSGGAIGGIVAGAVIGFVVASMLIGAVVYWKFSAARLESTWSEQFRQAHGQMNPLYTRQAVEGVNPLYNSEAQSLSV